MKCAIFAFTEEGRKLRGRLETAFKQLSFRGEQVTTVGFDSGAAVPTAFRECGAIIFIGAAGIAVRLISPLVKDKLSDPAVMVADEAGEYIIPILSGHVGGANELARTLGRAIGAVPVITTATDVNGMMAIDELAADNGLQIKGRDNIKRVSSRLLLGETINLAICDDVVITDRAGEVEPDELGLIVRPIAVGIGCRKGKSADELMEFYQATLGELGVDPDLVVGIASIDQKAKEPGLIALADRLQVPFVTYSAGELAAVPGEFESSSFVEDTVGVGDVSARAAKRLGRHGSFLLKKKRAEGMTISVFEKYRRVSIGYEKA